MRRHFNNLVYILFLVFGIITLLVTTNTNVYAQECFGTNDCSACGGDLICVPTKSLCCQIDPPNPLCPNGGCPHDCIEVQSIKCLVPGSECQCGVDNQGRCKSCGGGPDPSGNNNCSGGTVVDYTQPLSTVCSSGEQGYVMGNATLITGCCRQTTIKGTCEQVCEWKQGREVCRKVCTDDEVLCSQSNYTTYACVSTATPTPIPPTPTPIPVGTITARAVQITAADTSCAAIKAVPITAGQINGTTFQFSASSASQPPAQTQSGANYVTFANILAGWYSLSPVPPTANWAYARPCWTNITIGTTGEGLSQTLGANQTIAWDIGYTLGTAWLQTQGGDVYASGNLRSYIPNVTPRVFSSNGTGGYPGIVTYGTSYDLDSSPLSTGGTLVSSKNWQVNATRVAIDYYDYFYRRFGAPTATDNNSFPNLLSVAKPASRAKPHYIAGDMTTFGDWTVTTGETIIFIVTGNVTIGGKINITGDGFVAFIVNGNIIVNSTVGVSALSTASVLDGMYIVSPTGTFQTGPSTSSGSERFVGKGMFIAGNFLLERDLELVGANTASSAELFIYDPQLLFTLPDSMKDTSVSWQEVAP